MGALQGHIERGEWPAGTALPSETALCSEFGVSRGTVRAALKVLQDAGLVVAVPAKGRVVAGAGADDGVELAPARRARQVAAELRQELASGTYEAGSRFLSAAELEARFGVSRHTARLILGELESAGLLRAAHGKGHFVVGADDVHE